MRTADLPLPGCILATIAAHSPYVVHAPCARQYTTHTHTRNHLPCASAFHEFAGSQGSSAEQPVQPSTPAQPSPSRRRRQGTSEIRLLALDMDGTLLDSSSQVLPSSVEAIRAALGRGVTVMLATGKARPAAIKAMQTVGLAGEGLVVSTRSRGIFLQGLAVYGGGGALIGGGTLPPAVVQAAWRYGERPVGGALCCSF